MGGLSRDGKRRLSDTVTPFGQPLVSNLSYRHFIAVDVGIPLAFSRGDAVRLLRCASQRSWETFSRELIRGGK